MRSDPMSPGVPDAEGQRLLHASADGTDADVTAALQALKGRPTAHIVDVLSTFDKSGFPPLAVALRAEPPGRPPALRPRPSGA